MIQTPEALAAAAANLLPVEPAPTEAQIDDILNTLARAFSVEAALVGETRRLLHSRYRIRMDLGQTLKSDEVHEPWLASRRSKIEPYYWERYRQLLLRSGWSPLVASTLDRATNDLVDLLGDPEKVGPWKRRGLVVGDVQSGKTATYAAMICKAADAGYRMVILLTGILENVRRQTQERLDAAFVGIDSRDFLTSGQIGRKTPIGVGLIASARDGIVFTSRDSDFRRAAATALNISLASVKEPVLVVSKKNRTVLQRLAAWLRTRNADHAGRIDVPMLLIDDEADNASINTKSDPNETTAINRSIRDLLSLFTRSSYVGFTATPFANIFIDPASTNEMLGDDLFPSDFIHVLEAPTNYVGMNSLFGPVEPDAAEIPPAETQLRAITDEDDWLPVDHKKEVRFEGLPESMLESLRSYLLATTIRDLRASAAITGRGGGIHRSMLVNVSRFTDVQNRVADELNIALEQIRRAVRLYGALPPKDAGRSSEEIAALADTFSREFTTCSFAWSEVLKALHEAVSPIVVQPVNQTTGAASLDYSRQMVAPGFRVIAVGGNSLSRGLTLEGLSTSYFLRNARAYDTLLQMGRWFGYRDGYEDLCRLWVTAEAEGWYRHVTDATTELKQDFSRMRRQQATPREFGLRVRAHPDTLLITARNKMATGLDVTADTRDISLIGRMVESARLYPDERRNGSNFTLVNSFVGTLITTHGPAEESPHEGALLWRDVAAERVASFLEEFAVHPLNHDFQGDAIATFLRELPDRGGDELLRRWTVAIITSGTAEPVLVTSLQQTVPTTKRRVEERKATNSLLVSGSKARVGSRSDVRHGLSVEELRRVRDDFNGQGEIEREYRAAMKSPLMVIYLIGGYEKNEDGGSYRGGLVLPALGLHFPGSLDPDAPRQLVRYRLNRVAQEEFLGADFEDEEVPDEPDAED
jgi:hypothetical protein